MKKRYEIEYCPESKLYGVVDAGGGVLYEAMFTRNNALAVCRELNANGFSDFDTLVTNGIIAIKERGASFVI